MIYLVILTDLALAAVLVTVLWLGFKDYRREYMR